VSRSVADGPHDSAGPKSAWLRDFVARNGGVAGTIHRIDAGVLVLEAALNIPPPVVELTRQIPKGKGMAGLAWERERPVQTCNLKTDASGDVRPGARAVAAQGAVALPVRGADGVILGVVGIAFADERELAQDALEHLARDASSWPCASDDVPA